MAERYFAVDLNLGGNKAKEFRFEDLASDPTGSTGRVYYNTSGNVLKYYNGTSWVSVGAGNGTVTSVAVDLPNIFTTTGSPITTSGTITATLASQPANTVFAAPNGSNGAPSFRSLAEDDIPSLSTSKISGLDEYIQDITGGQIAAGDGITVSYNDELGTTTITNNDRGSAQNIFKTISVTGQTNIVADSNSDTLTFTNGTGITITTDSVSDAITITNSGVTSVNSLTGAISATNLLDAIKSVDGSGSGLDADTLDGNHASAFALATHTHTTGDITGIQEYVEDTVGAMVSTNTENGISVTYNDTTGKLDFDVSDFTITLAGDLSGSATVTNLGNVTLTATIAADSVALGTDTTGNYVASVTGSGSGISVTGTGEGAAVTISNTGVTAIAGTANEIEVSASTGSVTVGLPNSVSITNDLTVGGNLTVNGTVTTINSETITIDDNIIVLNDNVTGTPTENAGIEVERGTETNASLLWNETAGKWTAGIVGSEIAIARKYSSTINTTGGTPATVTHGLGTQEVVVQTYLGNSLIDCDIDITGDNTVTVTTNVGQTGVKVVVIG